MSFLTDAQSFSFRSVGHQTRLEDPPAVLRPLCMLMASGRRVNTALLSASGAVIPLGGRGRGPEGSPPQQRGPLCSPAAAAGIPGRGTGPPLGRRPFRATGGVGRVYRLERRITCTEAPNKRLEPEKRGLE